MAIVFENGGEIDMRAVTTMGVNVKEHASPFGYFGTGLKYAIAVLVRTGHHIVIHSGDSVYWFDKTRANVRGKDFDIVTMVDHDRGTTTELGFTTELGKNWKLWQVLRELYCNCEDELGRSRVVEDDTCGELMPVAGVTRVIVTGSDFEEVYKHELRDVILQSQPVSTDAVAAVHVGEGKHLYYRGVRAYDFADGVRTMYNYNIVAECALTEDRTIKAMYQPMQAIAYHLLQATDEDLIYSVLTAPEGAAERNISSFDDIYAPAPSEAFLAACERARRNKGKHTNASALRKLKLVRGAGALFSTVVLSPMQEGVLQKCITFCNTLGFAVHEYPINIVETLGDNVLGLADKGQLYVALRCFDIGNKMVANTLVEEFIHLRYNLDDESREMQNFLFDRLMTFGETIVGEVL